MPSNGWLVALFHQVRVTLAVVLALLALLAEGAAVGLLEELPLLHAAAAVAVVTASATAASARLLRMWSPDRGVDARHIVSKVFGILSACRHRKDGRHRGQPPVSMVLRTFSSLDDSRTMLREQRRSVGLRYREV